MSPYSRYEKRELWYIVGPDSTRYSEYIKASGGVKCDIYSPSSKDWDTLEYEERKLAAALNATEIEY